MKSPTHPGRFSTNYVDWRYQQGLLATEIDHYRVLGPKMDPDLTCRGSPTRESLK